MGLLKTAIAAAMGGPEAAAAEGAKKKRPAQQRSGDPGITDSPGGDDGGITDSPSRDPIEAAAKQRGSSTIGQDLRKVGGMAARFGRRWANSGRDQ